MWLVAGGLDRLFNKLEVVWGLLLTLLLVGLFRMGLHGFGSLDFLASSRYYLFKILETIQSRTPYKRGSEVKRIHVYKIYLQKVPRNKRNLNKSTGKIIKR